MLSWATQPDSSAAAHSATKILKEQGKAEIWELRQLLTMCPSASQWQEAVEGLLASVLEQSEAEIGSLHQLLVLYSHSACWQ